MTTMFRNRQRGELMGRTEKYLQTAIRSARRRISELVLMPEFAATYQAQPLEMILGANDRPFGVVYLEAVDLFHFVHAVDAGLKGNTELAGDRTSLAFASSKLAAEIYFSDLKHLSRVGAEVHTVGGPFVLMGLTRIMLQGDEELVVSWSEALCSAIALHGELITGTLADEGLATHIELAARCWLERRWARPSEMDESLGAYTVVWGARSDIEFHLALKELVARHFREIDLDELTPLAGLCYLAWPSEVLAMVPLYRKVRNPGFYAQSDAFPTAWLAPGRVASAPGETTSVVRQKAQSFYGADWVSLREGTPHAPRAGVDRSGGPEGR